MALTRSRVLRTLSATADQFDDIATLMEDAPGRNALCITDQRVVELLEDINWAGTVTFLREVREVIERVTPAPALVPPPPTFDEERAAARIAFSVATRLFHSPDAASYWELMQTHAADMLRIYKKHGR